MEFHLQKLESDFGVKVKEEPPETYPDTLDQTESSLSTVIKMNQLGIKQEQEKFHPDTDEKPEFNYREARSSDLRTVDISNKCSEHKSCFVPKRNPNLKILANRCHYCGIYSNQKSNLRYHIRTKHEEREDMPLVCSECPFTTDRTSKMKRHARYMHNDKPFWCPLCDAKEYSAEELKRHLTTAHARTAEQNRKMRKLFQCPHCWKRSDRMYNIKQHMLVKHTHQPHYVHMTLCT